MSNIDRHEKLKNIHIYSAVVSLADEKSNTNLSKFNDINQNKKQRTDKS